MKNLFSPLALALACALVATGCGKDKTKPSDDQVTRETAAAISDVFAIVGAADRRELVGRTVDINDTRVQAVVGNFVFWVGDERNQIPVVRQDKLKGPVLRHVKVGDSVRLGGVVQMSSNIAANDRIWENVNEKERRDIEAANVYIGADTVDVR